MHLQEQSEQKLLDLIDQGEHEAFGELLTRHYDTLFAFAFKYCRHQQDAEDILQESLLKISRNFHKYDRKNRFTTWAYRIIINTAKDMFRKEQRSREKHRDYATEATTVNSGADNTQDNGIWKLIDRLPKKLYDTMVLVYGQGLNHAEAAVTLGCAETTISWRLHRARKKISSQARKIGLVLLFLLVGGERWAR